jgi:hypothetical protein
MGGRDPLKTMLNEEVAPKPGAGKSGPESDAAGQSEKNHKGGSNDGTVSANPRVLSGKKDGDATFPIKKANKVG